MIHGELHQVDQAGHPGTSPVFITDPEEKIRFNGSHPVNQVERTYVVTVRGALEGLRGEGTRLLPEASFPGIQIAE